MRLFFRFIAILLASVAVPAAAQDGSESAEKRTIEGAQRFLSDFFQLKTVDAEVAGYVSGGDWRWENAPGYAYQMVRGNVVGMRGAGRCKSVMTLSNLRKKLWRALDPHTAIPVTGGQVEKEVDWSKLSSFKVADGWQFEQGGPNTVPTGQVEVRLYSASGFIFLQHAEKAEADRIGFAIQFLKDQCGFKSETGF